MRTFIVTAIVSLALAGAAVAQTTAPATTKTTKPMAAPAATMASKPAKTASTVGRKPMTEASKACSAQADAKSLHGKDREKFRRSCMKGKS